MPVGAGQIAAAKLAMLQPSAAKVGAREVAIVKAHRFELRVDEIRLREQTVDEADPREPG